MSTIDMMYQLYPSYFSHKSSSNEYSKFSSSGFPDSLHHSHTGHYLHSNSLNSCSGSERNDEIENETDMDTQPKGSQYLNPNCVLLTYFTGDTSAVVDEHFTRALSQPSSFNLDRNFSSSFTAKQKTDKPLMCHRKLPPSFWNSAYKPPPPQIPASSTFDYSRDPYFPSSWYSLQNNWPYRLPSHGHSELSSTLSYPSFETAGKLGSPYQSLMFPGSYDTRQSKYDFAKNMESLTGSSSYYGLSRLGMDFTPKGNVDPSVSGLEYQLQSARRELCW